MDSIGRCWRMSMKTGGLRVLEGSALFSLRRLVMRIYLKRSDRFNFEILNTGKENILKWTLEYHKFRKYQEWPILTLFEHFPLLMLVTLLHFRGNPGKF